MVDVSPPASSLARARLAIHGRARRLKRRSAACVRARSAGRRRSRTRGAEPRPPCRKSGRSHPLTLVTARFAGVAGHARRRVPRSRLPAPGRRGHMATVERVHVGSHRGRTGKPMGVLIHSRLQRSLRRRTQPRGHVDALRTSHVPLSALPALKDERRLASSRLARDPATNLFPRDRRAGVGEMSFQAPLQFSDLLGREGSELVLALFFIEALPESHGDLGAFSGR